MPSFRLGTMGFSYKDWSGAFYPETLAPRDYLAHYAHYFDAVELDSTFYGTPRPEVVERWAAVTPPSFKFCAKTPREISHELRLAGAADAMNAFLRVMRLLGDKLGVILIQLPPDLSFDHIHTLAVFLRGLPTDLRYAVEFRHRSWNATATAQLLETQRVCWASTDYIHLPQRVYMTTDFLYVRWIGRHGRYTPKDHERVDLTRRLEAWWADIRGRLNGVHTLYGFFNNDYAGFAPATANRFKAILGLPVQRSEPPQQERLL
ncbi:MAG: DUF72 domain-containing protein [Candidatus Promineifilaceae bacterium]